MNIKKITAFAAAVVIAAGICTGVPTGTGTGSLLAVTASANTVSNSFPKDAAATSHVPANFSATGGNGTIDVKWDAVSGASSYYVSADKKQADGTYMSAAYKNVAGTSCKLENLPADTYSIFIKADNSDSGVSLDNVVVTDSAKTEEKTSGNSYAPTVKLYDDNTADVTWKEVKGAYFYAIYVYIYDDWDESVSQEMIFVSPTAKKDFKSGDLSVKAISEAKYTVDLSAMPKGGYAFIYVAPADKNNKSMVNTTGVSTASLKVNKRSTASSSSKTAAPANFKASKTNNSVTLSWDKADGADMYRVYKYNDKTGKYEKYKDVKSAKCTVSGLKANTKYKFKVVSYSKNKDGKYVKGESSKAVSVTTKK